MIKVQRTKASKIYVAGHLGLVGSAVVRALGARGYSNLVLRSRHELDLTDQSAVRRFFKDERPEDEEIRRLGSAAVATGARGAADLGFLDHQAVIEDMVRAVAEGREPMITLASVRPTLEWALAMYQSAKQGTPVELPILDEDAVW